LVWLSTIAILISILIAIFGMPLFETVSLPITLILGIGGLSIIYFISSEAAKLMVYKVLRKWKEFLRESLKN
jgi:hypothetical protein